MEPAAFSWMAISTSVDKCHRLAFSYFVRHDGVGVIMASENQNPVADLSCHDLDNKHICSNIRRGNDHFPNTSRHAIKGLASEKARAFSLPPIDWVPGTYELSPLAVADLMSSVT